MRITRSFTSSLFTGTLIAGGLLLGAAGSATADASPSPSATSSDASAQGPTEAGTSFRTATAFRPGQQATATGSTGDYLYWMFPVDAGQRATVSARVTFPDSAVRKGASKWQLDVYDGLRRHQSCVYGAQSRTVAPDVGSIELRCTLRTVRAWAEPWSNDPLPGSYYVRVTVVNAQQQDLGLPVQAAVGATAASAGGAHAVGGRLAVPLTPGTAAGQAGAIASATASGDGSSGQDDGSTDDDTGAVSQQAAGVAVEPEDGWSSGWWSDRWLWTAAGGVLGALAGIAGYTLARPSRSYRRPAGTPPPVPPQY